MTDLNVKLIDLAHKALFERGPVRDPHIETFRRYAPQPAADEPREEEVEPRDAEEYFLEEQCPSDATFR